MSDTKYYLEYSRTGSTPTLNVYNVEDKIFIDPTSKSVGIMYSGDTSTYKLYNKGNIRSNEYYIDNPPDATGKNEFMMLENYDGNGLKFKKYINYNPERNNCDNYLYFIWIVKNPAVGGIPGPIAALNNLTALRVDAFVSGGTNVVFNLEERSVITAAGTGLTSGNVTAVVTGVTTTTFANSSIAEGNWVFLNIVSLSGSPSYLSITLALNDDGY